MIFHNEKNGFLLKKEIREGQSSRMCWPCTSSTQSSHFLDSPT